MKKKFACLIITFMLAMCFTTAVVLANDGSENSHPRKDLTQENASSIVYQINSENRLSDSQKEQMQIAHERTTSLLSACTVWDDERYIGINKPAPGTTFYYGNGYIEYMWTDITCYDTWEDYYTLPGYAVFDEYDDMVLEWDGDEFVDTDDSNHYTGNISIADLDEGTYEMWVWAMPCNADGTTAEDWGDWDNVPSAYITFKVKKLAAPKGVKATAGKKKITVRYNKVSGAQKYQVYRSTSKYGSFTRIATTSSTKYVDKKVKKGKKYYYKVRSYRPSTDISSSFSSVAQSGKVK